MSPPSPSASSGWRPRAQPLALAVALATTGALAYAAVAHGPGAEPLDAVPAASFLIASVDVAALRASPLYDVVFDKDRGAAAGGVGELALACGFDPLTRVGELALAIPEGGESGDFGVAASAELTRDELVRCAENVAGTRGETRKVEEVGTFHFVADDKGHALAVRDTGPILVGRAAFVRAMVDAAERRAPSAKESREHTELREAVSTPTARGGGAPSRALVVVTALLPGELRDRLKREMGAELGVPGSNAPMGGVLGVRAAGLALRETSGGMLEARAELRCDSAGACEEVRKLVLAKRLALSQDVTLRLVGLGPAIDAFEAAAEGTTLSATTRARTSDLAAALERVLGRLRPASRAPLPTPRLPARPAPRPDEVLPARGDSGTPEH